MNLFNDLIRPIYYPERCIHNYFNGIIPGSTVSVAVLLGVTVEISDAHWFYYVIISSGILCMMCE